ncbi:MAG: GNAT family N-acetyltransferase [Rhodanobacteraceae bacterium]
MTRVREAVATDAQPLAVLSAQLGYPADPATIEKRLRDIGRHDGVVLVALGENDAVRGFAHVVPLHFLIVEPFVDLAGLVVGETSRGLGVGKALLAGVETWSRRHGFASVRVRSNVIRERAHRFYLREGYAENKRQAVFVKRL